MSLLSHQAQFHQRWGHLKNRHVRNLAWLLDAPDLLDPQANAWQGRLASLAPPDANVAHWLAELDLAPEPLLDALKEGGHQRLGRYAESLLGFYLQRHAQLVGSNVQVRDANKTTIGEFDFLIQQADGLVHWEFATKLYLLSANSLHGSAQEGPADYFVGPNLADSLGKKIRKIMTQQLQLSTHSGAQAVLPEPVVRAQALIKGWLFYPRNAAVAPAPEWVTDAHCRGFWCTFDAYADHAPPSAMVLPRLTWLAPVLADAGEVLSQQAALDTIAAHHAERGQPALVAGLVQRDGEWIEFERGFVVPNDWPERARLQGKAQSAPVE